MSNVISSRLIVLGSGPAGYTAAIYAARAGLNPIVIQGIQPGGQLTTTTDVENYPGFRNVIQGPWLMEEMQAQAEHVGTKMIWDHVSSVDLSRRPFLVTGDRGKRVAVIGGGNTAVEEAIYMTNHSQDVTLIHRRDSLRAEKILQDRLFANPHIKIVWNAEVAQFLSGGEPEALTGLELRDTQTGA